MKILWPSRLCDCSFEMEFDETRDTRTRPYKVVGWGPDEEEVEAPYDAYPLVTAVHARDACPKHDTDDYEAAFKIVLGEHKAAGYGEDYRKITVNGWTALCGCVVTKQFHVDNFDGGNHIIGPAIRRCDAHQHLEGTQVFHQVRMESVELTRAYEAVREVCAPMVERFWSRPDGQRVWEADVSPEVAETAKVLLGEPTPGYREEPSVTLLESRQVQVVLPKTMTRFAKAIRRRVPEASVVVREG